MKAQFILIGSQQFALMEGVSESLAGRLGVAELEGLSLAEISSWTEADPGDQEHHFVINSLFQGGFPALWSEPELDLHDFFQAYLVTYLERDLRQLINVTQLHVFELFLKICADRTGQTVEKAALAREVGINVRTCQEWLNVLVTSGVIQFVSPWYSNVGKRLIKSPKLYFRDSGLLCYLLGLSQKHYQHSQLIGAIWETLALAELRKILAVQREPANLWFYRDTDQLEVDFLIQKGGRTFAIECKWSESPGRDAGRGLRSFKALIEKNTPKELGAIEYLLLCRTTNEFPLGEGIWATSLFDLPKRLRTETS